MTATSKRLPTRLVILGGREYDKPWDPSCGACRSPWLGSIDSCLAEGYALRAIRKLLAGLKPAVPNEVILRAHIAHLAEPHRKQRLAFEAAAGARGESTDTESARIEDALAAIIGRGSELLASGELDVGAREMLSAMKLQAQLTREREGEGVEASAWQAAFMAFFEIVRRHLSPAQWRAFTDDVYASPEIRAVLMDGQAALPGGDG
jgi:hypothetical protein